MSDMMKVVSLPRQSEENRILLFFLMKLKRRTRMYSMYCYRYLMTDESPIHRAER